MEMNSTDLEIGQDKEVVLPASGSIKRKVKELSSIEVVDKPIDRDQMAALAFMEEKLTVMLHEDADPNAENPVQISCNGINQFFIRGESQDVKRKYVEILARAKRTRISTPEITDNSGSRTNLIRQSSSLRYPFSVMHDPNPKGMPWLKAVMSETA